MKIRQALLVAAGTMLAGLAQPARAQTSLDEKIDSNISDWVGTYKYLHEHPELSTEEKETEK